MEAHRMHDISDKVWGLLESHLSGRSDGWGGVASGNRPRNKDPRGKPFRFAQLYFVKRGISEQHKLVV